MNAAERVFLRTSPDAASLKLVAIEAETSPALISHYFGTYENLVEATLERRVLRSRDSALMALSNAPPGAKAPGSGALVALVEDRLTLRLVMWALLTGRTEKSDFFMARNRGMRMVVDGLMFWRKLGGQPEVDRRDAEFTVMATMALAFGLALAREPMEASLGEPLADPAHPIDEEMQERVREMCELYLEAAARRKAGKG